MKGHRVISMREEGINYSICYRPSKTDDFADELLIKMSAGLSEQGALALASVAGEQFLRAFEEARQYA